MKSPPFFARYAWWILACFALATPLIAYSALRTVRSNTNKVEDWLPATFAETHDLRWFRRFFVADQFVVISWEGCRLGGNPAEPGAEADDPRIERLAQRLVPSRRDTSREVRGSHQQAESQSIADSSAGGYFTTVTTGRRVLDQLTSPPTNVPYDAAVERLKGSLIGPDGRQTCLVVTLSDESLADLRAAIGRGDTRMLRRNHVPGALFEACEASGIPVESVHIGGPPVDNVAIDEEGERTLIRLAGLSGLLGLALAWSSLRSFKLTLIVFATGLLSAMSGLAAVWLTGETADAVLMSMPALIYVLAVSGAIHIINYYRDAVQDGGLLGAPERAIAHGWKPTLFCSVTTAIGLLSLYASDLEPIRKFGLYSAVGVFAMLGVLLLYLPAALQLWPIRSDFRSSGEPSSTSGAADARDLGGPATVSWADRMWRNFGRLIIRRHTTVAIACITVVAFVGWGITRTRTSIDLLKLFDNEARILADYRWLEEHLGRLIPMEIVLRFPPDTQHPIDAGEAASEGAVNSVAANSEPPTAAIEQLSFLDRMQIVSIIQQSIERRLGSEGQNLVGRTMSAVTFAPELPGSSGATMNFIRRTATDERLAAHRPAFERSGYFRIDPADGAELWRISLRVAAFEEVDFGKFAEDLRQTVEPVLAAHRYRGEVLREIAARRGSPRVAGASVLLWQHPPDARGASCGQPDGPPASAADEIRHETLPAHAIVSASMHAFLRRDRLRVAKSTQDPSDLTPPSLSRLGAYDAVVLVGDFRPADVKAIGRAASRVVIASPPELRPTEPRSHSVMAGLDATASTGTIKGRITATYTGVVPIVYKTQRVLLASLIESAFWSFITITPLMMFVCRSVSGGAVAMLPNVLPVLVVFGGMGWLELPVDIGSMMAASIALGVAVDDTIHYLTWFRDDLEKWRDRPRAILGAYRRCATPTLQAALVNGLGLAVFVFSTFTPTRQFGFLMLTILIAGVVAELVMLPALLAGPLGRAFHPRASRRPCRSPDEE